MESKCHYYMRLEDQGFSVFYSEIVYNGAGIVYLGFTDRASAIRRAYRKWPEIAPPYTDGDLLEFEKTIGGTD